MKLLSSLIPTIILLASSFLQIDGQYLFGIHASLQTQNNTVTITTNGEQVGEGIVHTVNPVTSSPYTFAVRLRGTGHVMLKLSETSIKGRFLHETTSKPITLSNEWKNYTLTADLHAETNEIDQIILTTEKEKAIIQMKIR